MPVYTVHLPVDEASRAAKADRAVFVRDGVSVFAFIFGPLWLLAHRLWLALIVYLVVLGGIEVTISLLQLSGGLRMVVMLLLAVLMGAEAQNIKRWSYSRGNWREAGLVVADNLEAAEYRFFAGETTSAPPPFPPSARSSSFPMGSSPLPLLSRADTSRPIVGLFPEPGGSR